ncbi:MAG: DUF3871 family protein [Psychroflexus halocasei]|uniref:DUF3871 family protein n=1 Tax=Psychroflexus sp. S27 TaxID=1982757 RepID=UPI000C29CBF2|nr:DUF3871 family protein [Psychroflexus sp. S27]PJX20135.1 hypothetical protein CAP47_11420 [Psychroflexus sp. S27]
MEKIIKSPQVISESDLVDPDLKGNTFIGGNSIEVSLDHLKNDCIIPVFSKDNETTISHYQFVNEMQKVIETAFPSIKLTRPLIKVSHTIKGRIPSAIGKPAKDLEEHEKTIYYERCAFIFQVLGSSINVNGNQLNLTIGGVRAYNQENLYSTKSLEKFKIFIGYQNMVCLNLCVSSDGFTNEIKIGSIVDLNDQFMRLLENYNREKHLGMLERMSKFKINEKQFAHLLGKLRIYNYLDKAKKAKLPEVLLTDSQINNVAKAYLDDPAFSCDADGNINFWEIYNLLTQANKTSYIDNNIERNVNAYEFMNTLGDSLLNEEPSWFIPHFI